MLVMISESREKNPMSRTFHFELGRAFGSKWFKLALAFGLLLVVAQAATIVVPYGISDDWAMWRSGYKNVYPISLYNSWFGMTGYSPFTTLFYLVIPILACLPYGWSLLSDESSGYRIQICTRDTTCHYIASKYMSSFLSGAFVVTAPLLAGVLIGAAFLPQLTPEVTSGMFPIFVDDMFAEVFYRDPYLYVGIYIGLSFIVSGLLACLPFALSEVSMSKLMVIVLPFLFFIIFSQVFSDSGFTGSVPSFFLAPYQPSAQDANSNTVFYGTIFLAVLISAVRQSYRCESL